jgi:hypothetical protein
MKRRITIEQLNELSDDQKQRLRDWCESKISYDDDIVDVWLPYNNIHHIGWWDYETEFEKSEYIGKIKNYEGEMWFLVDIGQMIELLEDMHICIRETRIATDLRRIIILSNCNLYEDKNWCDAYWKAVKAVL